MICWWILSQGDASGPKPALLGACAKDRHHRVDVPVDAFQHFWGNISPLWQGPPEPVDLAHNFGHRPPKTGSLSERLPTRLELTMQAPLAIAAMLAAVFHKR